MGIARARVAWNAWGLERRAARARRDERRALASAGRTLLDAHLPEDLHEHAERIRQLDQRMASLHADLVQSLEADRSDFARASERMRWCVIARGLLDRVFLREEARKARHELPAAESELGRAAFEPRHAGLRERLPSEIVRAIEECRAIAQAAEQERARRLAPYGEEPLPRAVAWILRELGSLGRHLGRQLSIKLFLRAPALAALVAGWWVGRWYTKEWWDPFDWFHDRSTRQRLGFWLPILAAAACAWAMALVTRWVQRRYARPAAQAQGGQARISSDP
jgi:hypothetical protein